MAFDYSTKAALFSPKGANFRCKGIEYRRFVRAAEAIRFAMEDVPSTALDGCSLEVAEERYVGNEIRGLYESVDFPLARRRRTKFSTKRSK